MLDSSDFTNQSRALQKNRHGTTGVQEGSNRTARNHRMTDHISPESTDVSDSNDTEEDDNESDDDDITEYRRVRVLSRSSIRWNPDDCSRYLEVSSDGLGVRFDGPQDTFGGDYRGWAVRSTKPFSPLGRTRTTRLGNEKNHRLDAEWFDYFEVKVINGGERKYVPHDSLLYSYRPAL